MLRPSNTTVAVAVFLTCLQALAQAAGPAPAEMDPPPKDPSPWFMYWGAANLHSDLKESEAKIDRELNGTLGMLIPTWKKPITLKDWSDEFRLWDAHVGVGRDLSPKWAWFLGTGGTTGTLKNDDPYVFPLPLRVQADFTRTLKFVVTGLNWYPWGKPHLQREPGGNRLLESLRATRPFLELATSYMRLKTVADVRVSTVGARLFKKYEECDYNLFHISPRVGIETPLGKKDSIAVEMGYLFFNRHPSEFNNFSIYVFHRHRF